MLSRCGYQSFSWAVFATHTAKDHIMESTIATALNYVYTARATKDPERTLRQMCKGIASLCTIVGLDGLPCSDLEQRREAFKPLYFDRQALHRELDRQIYIEAQHRAIRGFYVHLCEHGSLIPVIKAMMEED